MNKKMIDILLYVVLPVALLLAGFYFGQRKLLYLPSRASIEPSSVNIDYFSEVSFETADGLRLRSWYQPARNNQATLVYFHGNAGHVANRAPFVKAYLEQGFGVLLLEYRGYGGNPSSPTEQGLYQDARAAIRYMQQQGVKNERLVLFGESLGTGVAVQMATEFPIKALILQTPYTSMVDVGRYHYPFLPVRLFLKDRYDSINKISTIKQPLLILHGLQDRVVPVRMAKRLYQAANSPKHIHYYDEKGHNDIISRQLQRDVLAFLQRYAG